MAYTPDTKSKGDLIRSQDWNDTTSEVVRLESDKVDRGGDAITGSLTINGSLGVGTTASSDAKLYLRRPNTGSTQLLKLGNVNQPNFEWSFDVDSSSQLSINNEGNGSPFTALTVNGAGNIGIGKAPSSAKLDINGSTTIDGALSVSGAASIGGSFSVRTDDLVVSNNGRVGIGYATPSYKLEVRDSNNNYIVSFNNTNAGYSYGLSVYASSYEHDSSAYSYGAQFYSRASQVGGNSYGSLNYANAYGSSNAYAVYAAATSGSTSGREYAFYGIGDNYFSGNVGIGTTDAGADKLDVRGRCYSSGGWQTTNADYGEYFESEGKTTIRVGTSVTLDENGKIKPAKKGDTPIGIVTLSSAFVGNSYKEWPKKYLRDEFGNLIMKKQKVERMVPKKEIVKKQRQKVEKKTITEKVSRFEVVLKGKKHIQQEVKEKVSREIEEPLFKEVDLYDKDGKKKIGKTNIPVMEEYEEEIDVLGEDGLPVMVGSGEYDTKELPVLNPDYNEKVVYVPREDRPEWHCVGLLGQLALRKGQPVADHWLKLKEMSDKTELWLVK